MSVDRQMAVTQGQELVFSRKLIKWAFQYLNMNSSLDTEELQQNPGTMSWQTTITGEDRIWMSEDDW